MVVEITESLDVEVAAVSAAVSDLQLSLSNPLTLSYTIDDLRAYANRNSCSFYIAPQ